jgi:hypothetical protein
VQQHCLHSQVFGHAIKFNNPRFVLQDILYNPYGAFVFQKLYQLHLKYFLYTVVQFTWRELLIRTGDKLKNKKFFLLHRRIEEQKKIAYGHLIFIA